MDLSDSLRFLERKGCHLCDDAWEIVERLGHGGAERVDIEHDDDLLGTYGLRIPVLLDVDFGVLAEGQWNERELRKRLKRRERRRRKAR